MNIISCRETDIDSDQFLIRAKYEQGMRINAGKTNIEAPPFFKKERTNRYENSVAN